MAKNVPVVDASAVDSKPFVTSKGFKVLLRGIPPLELPLLYNSIERPKPPTYTVEIAGGDTQTFQHEVDEEKGVSTLVSDEDKKAWSDYIASRDMVDALLADRITTAALMDGIDISQEALSNEYPRWEKRMQMKGLQVPEDPSEKELLFKRTFVVASASDLKNIVVEVLALSGVSQDLIDSTKASFPDNVESGTQS